MKKTRIQNHIVRMIKNRTNSVNSFLDEEGRNQFMDLVEDIQKFAEDYVTFYLEGLGRARYRSPVKPKKDGKK